MLQIQPVITPESNKAVRRVVGQIVGKVHTGADQSPIRLLRLRSGPLRGRGQDSINHRWLIDVPHNVGRRKVLARRRPRPAEQTDVYCSSNNSPAAENACNTQPVGHLILTREF